MKDPHKIYSVTIEGIGGILHPQKFDLFGQENLVIFAPNGLGKTSIVNGFELVLSKDGKISTLS